VAGRMFLPLTRVPLFQVITSCTDTLHSSSGSMNVRMRCNRVCSASLLMSCDSASSHVRDSLSSARRVPVPLFQCILTSVFRSLGFLLFQKHCLLLCNANTATANIFILVREVVHVYTYGHIHFAYTGTGSPPS
jgi:hypothetical protein